MLANRLAKNARHLAKWAKREGVSCYRVYDCDIPEVPLTVDRYLTDEGEHVTAALWEGTVTHGREWVAAMCEAVATTLGVEMARLHLKRRTRQAGAAQYERLGSGARRQRVEEGGLAFWVNFEDYLDTGLFLDHRVMRARVRAEAAGKDVLNLFAYTGAFTVYAAAGGARSTTTLDMSQTYLDWARDNLALNRLAGEHRLLRADILQWLGSDDADALRRWDLAVVDPPTFSNSKKMRASFDVQRDHVTLLRQVYARMRPRGVVYFSSNARRFKPLPEAFAGLARVDEISHESVPADFRDRKIHRAWRLELG